MVRLIPGDPARAILGDVTTPERIAEVRQVLGLDRPWLEQLVSYCVGLAIGDLGRSFALFNRPVGEIIAERLGSSLRLAASALAMVVLTSVPLGLLLGAYTKEGRHRRFEVAFTAASSVAGAIPEFLMATFLVFVFAVWLRILPVAGGLGVEGLILPVLAVSLRPIVLVARIVRVETLNVLATDYVRTARSKQLPSYLIYGRHVLPNVVTAALTIGGLVFAEIVGGAVIVENIFNMPGLGTILVAAIRNHDYPLIQGSVLVLGCAVVLANALADISVAVINPRSLINRT